MRQNHRKWVQRHEQHDDEHDKQRNDGHHRPYIDSERRMTADESLETFELELLGGGAERRYRRMRPEVEQLPWGSFDPTLYSDDVLQGVRASWTRAAFQEHRTGVACALALRALIEARAPLDLVAIGTRFPLDEMVHVELCARMAMLAGGPTEIRHVPRELIKDPPADLSPLQRAADIMVRLFCVGEAVSIPVLRGAWHASKHPLPKAILARIVRDEAAHGTFGFTFLDWALPRLGADDKAHLGEAADRAVLAIHAMAEEEIAGPPRRDSEVAPIGWMDVGDYVALVQRTLQRKVVEPLRRRGIPIHADSGDLDTSL